MNNDIDLIVVGGGHAGAEAALITARMGLSTLLVTGRKDAIAQMPCNPSIGGLGKSHLVYELDALGGEMGFNADQTALQEKTLNTSRGPAVRATRAQCDKRLYTKRMQRVVESQPNLAVMEDVVIDLLVEQHDIANTVSLNTALSDTADRSFTASVVNGENDLEIGGDGRRQKAIYNYVTSCERNSSLHGQGILRITGIRTERNGDFKAKAVVVTSGTSLRGRIFIGHDVEESGGDGRPAANLLSESLERLGFQLIRLMRFFPLS